MGPFPGDTCRPFCVGFRGLLAHTLARLEAVRRTRVPAPRQFHFELRREQSAPPPDAQGVGHRPNHPQQQTRAEHAPGGRTPGEVVRQDAFLELAPDDTFLVLNAILNELSQSFAAGALAKSMGLPVHSQWYVFGITCEWDDEVKNRKIRVMIIAEDLLESLDRLPPLEYQHPWHRVRHATLLTMLGLYREDCRAEVADRQQRQQREAQLAAMSDQQRSKALEKDRESEQRSPPVRNLMRVELGVS